MVLLCAVIISVPVLDVYRVYAVSETAIAIGTTVAVAVALGVVQGGTSAIIQTIGSDAGIRQRLATVGVACVEGGKRKFRMSLLAASLFKAYIMDRLGLKHDVPTTAAPVTQPVTEPNIFQFNTVEYPAEMISYGSDGNTVSGISYDSTFLADHILWETGNTAQSIDSREDSYFSALQEGFYFTGTTTRSGYQVSSNVIWSLGDLRYKLSTSGSTYGSTVSWKVFEPLYFINQGTGNRELLLCAVMTGSTDGTSTKFQYASTPILDIALNSNATDWFSGTQPPLRASFGRLNPVVNKTYSQTACNYREYSYEVWTGNAVEATTTYETTTEPNLVNATNDGGYDSDYDITEKLKGADPNSTYVNVEVTKTAQAVGEAIESGTDLNTLTKGQKAQIRDLSKDVQRSITVNGTTSTTEAVTDGTGAVVTPAVTSLSGDVPLNDFLDANVTETGEYQGLISRIADGVQSLLNTVKSIPQTISNTGQFIVDSIDYQINPNSPQFDDPFMTFFINTISNRFPAADDFRTEFNSFSASDSPLVLDYDVMIGSRTFHFSADFSWFENYRSRFRSGVGVLFWLLAWFAVLRGFLGVFHIELNHAGGLESIFHGYGAAGGASHHDSGGYATKQ